ncbi:MAG: hypothetical protein HN786_05655 [Cellvibrionales bacterium]|jgi:hypothetical protein|nr:hypothetical protein [Cellvibrionales bacterium]
MTDQEIEKITVTIANEFLNSFNLNGLVAAAKHYSIHLAKERVDTLGEEELKKIMSEILEREKEAAEKGETSEPRVTTSVNPEAQ